MKEQFLAIIHRAIEDTTVWGENDSAHSDDQEVLEPVEFLWLDVACIDQRPDQPESALEIGRQGDISRGARHTFIWSTTFTYDDLQSMMSDIEPVNKWQYRYREDNLFKRQARRLPDAQLLER